MALAQKKQTIDLSQKMKLDENASAKIEQAKNLREQLAGVYDKLESGSLKTYDLARLVKEGELSTLEAGLNQASGFTKTIADLAAGLTDDLQQFTSVTKDSAQYQGFEKVWSWIPLKAAHAKADRMRVNRIQQQTPEQNLQQVLEYAAGLYKEICETREVAILTQSRLEANLEVVVGKIAEYEPKTAALKEKADLLEADYKTRNDAYQVAEATEQAKLLPALNALHHDMTEAQNAYQQSFTVYNQAQQAYRLNLESKNGFDNMVLALGRQATLVKEKADNLTAVYMAAPKAIQIMLVTRGMESVDKSMNTSAQESLDLITNAAYAVQDATLAREEIEIINVDKMREFIERIEKTEEMYRTRHAVIEQNAARSQSERYAPN